MTSVRFAFVETEPYLDRAKRESVAASLPFERGVRILSTKDETLAAERVACEVALRRALRDVKERYSDLRVTRDERGKPYIDARPDLSVSFSHTDGLSCCAVVKTEGGIAPSVGCDAELLRPVAGRDGIARRCFDPTLAAAVEEGGENADRLFLSEWTLREAEGKRAGVGLASVRENPTPPAHITELLNLFGRTYVFSVALGADLSAEAKAGLAFSLSL